MVRPERYFDAPVKVGLTVIAEWNKQGSVEQVLKVFEAFDPAVKALIAKVDPSTLKVWQLLDMEQMPTSTKGKMVLLGDAGHPFTPREYTLHPALFPATTNTSMQIRGKEQARRLKMLQL